MLGVVKCPSESAFFDCPYFNRGQCFMAIMCGDGPEGQCDEYDFYNQDDEEEEEE